MPRFSNHKMMNVIIANGECPTHPTAVELLRTADHVVCCDGALRHLVALGITPTVVVGDGDSISEALYAQYKHLYQTDASTEYNDLTKAYNYCRQQGWNDIAVVGASGLRDDHALANLALLVRHAREFRTFMVSNHGIFTPISKTTEFPSEKGQQVSVFNFTPGTRLTFHGLRYPVEKRCFHELWEGALNESLGAKFTIEMNDPGEILVYQAFLLNS